MARVAAGAVNRLFQPGFNYSKAEVLLMELRQHGELTDDLFAHSQPQAAEKVMSFLDEINQRWAGERYAPVAFHQHRLGGFDGK